MIKINQIKIPFSEDNTNIEKELYRKILKLLNLKGQKAEETGLKLNYRIIRRSLDARKKPELYFIFSVLVDVDEKIENKILKANKNNDISKYSEKEYQIPDNIEGISLNKRPCIIGAGPAGLFCAYVLCQKGYKPIVVERGQNVDKRVETVELFWSKKIVNEESNVQFGEGGAGTFSDGKLNTLVKDPCGRNGYVLNTFVKFGAKDSIAYDAKPHVGTDKLIDVVKNMRKYIIDQGGQFLFSCKMTEIVCDKNCVKSIIVDNYSDEEYLVDDVKIKPGKNTINTDIVVLAIGHSARDTFEKLYNQGIEMHQKNFAVGLRIQHPQSIINKAQYGREYVKGLKAAEYKLTNKASNGRSVYSFCMCPGGYVVNASSEKNRLAVNGMSYSERDSENANSALIVSVDSKDYMSEHPLAGMYFQRKLEEKAYTLGSGNIPTQLYKDYKNDNESTEFLDVNPLSKGEHKLCNLRQLFCEEINSALIESIEKFGYTMKGFNMDGAVLMGVESRTSSPVRICRDENFESNIKGIMPCGEGAGYAGGITSAAMDGIKVAEEIIKKYKAVYDE